MQPDQPLFDLPRESVEILATKLGAPEPRVAPDEESSIDSPREDATFALPAEEDERGGLDIRQMLGRKPARKWYRSDPSRTGRTRGTGNVRFISKRRSIFMRKRLWVMLIVLLLFGSLLGFAIYRGIQANASSFEGTVILRNSLDKRTASAAQYSTPRLDCIL